MWWWQHTMFSESILWLDLFLCSVSVWSNGLSHTKFSCYLKIRTLRWHAMYMWSACVCSTCMIVWLCCWSMNTGASGIHSEFPWFSTRWGQLRLDSGSVPVAGEWRHRYWSEKVGDRATFRNSMRMYLAEGGWVVIPEHCHLKDGGAPASVV